MSTLTITRGLPASGKTTWAKAWVAASPTTRARVNRDDYRAMMYAEPTYQWDQEAAVTEASRAAVKALLKMGRDVVADDMNLRPKYVREWARFAQANGVELEVVEFPLSLDESVERDARRAKPVGEAAIRRMAKYLAKGHLAPVPDDYYDHIEVDRYTPRPGTPLAVIVDIDGTVALNTCGRSPYDLTRVSEDTPNPSVVWAVHAAHNAGAQVIYLSGREDVCRDDTEAWLAEHVAVPGPLYMRPATDKRKDSIVKRELFDCHVRDDFDVLYVLDDRKQVVEMWRSLGLTVMQVAEGDF